MMVARYILSIETILTNCGRFWLCKCGEIEVCGGEEVVLAWLCP